MIPQTTPVSVGHTRLIAKEEKAWAILSCHRRVSPNPMMQQTIVPRAANQSRIHASLDSLREGSFRSPNSGISRLARLIWASSAM